MSHVAAEIIRKNNDAARPEGQHWDFSAKAHAENPDCGTGKHFSLDTYKYELD